MSDLVGIFYVDGGTNHCSVNENRAWLGAVQGGPIDVTKGHRSAEHSLKRRA